MKALTAIVFGVILNAVSFSSFGVEIEHGDFMLTHEESNGNQFCIQSPKYGYWCGYFSIEAPERGEARTHVVSFMFFSPDYFIETNVGHLGVGLRAHSVFPDGDVSRIEARGHGVLLGNLTQYPKVSPGCGPTNTKNTVTFQTWWNDGQQKNCVMGWRESVQLKNNTYYRIMISSTRDNGMYVEYVLEKYMDGVGWAMIGHDSMFDFTPASGNTDGGIFIASVFSNYRWTFYISDLVEEWR